MQSAALSRLHLILVQNGYTQQPSKLDKHYTIDLRVMPVSERKVSVSWNTPSHQPLNRICATPYLSVRSSQNGKYGIKNGPPRMCEYICAIYLMLLQRLTKGTGKKCLLNPACFASKIRAKVVLREIER